MPFSRHLFYHMLCNFGSQRKGQREESRAIPLRAWIWRAQSSAQALLHTPRDCQCRCWSHPIWQGDLRRFSFDLWCKVCVCRICHLGGQKRIRWKVVIGQWSKFICDSTVIKGLWEDKRHCNCLTSVVVGRLNIPQQARDRRQGVGEWRIYHQRRMRLCARIMLCPLDWNLSACKMMLPSSYQTPDLIVVAGSIAH